MIDPACLQVTDVTRVKVEEKGKSAIVLNADRVRWYRKIKVDGCVTSEGLRSDWVIEYGDHAVIVELKGSNVEHGADQVFATAKRWSLCEPHIKEICGLIVGRQYPKFSTSMQLKQDKFRKLFRCPLHVVTCNGEYVFEHLFSFKGPFRA